VELTAADLKKIKKTTGKFINFVTPDGQCSCELSPLKNLIRGSGGALISAEIEHYTEARKWMDRAEVIEPLYDEEHARRQWGPVDKYGRPRPYDYHPPDRLGRILLTYGGDHNRGVISLYLFVARDGFESVCVGCEL
jgi:hypothetical protein